MKFLSAHWKHLLLANYCVDASVLRPFVPIGTRLDDFDGQVILSLVAFLFDQTRVLGIPVPLHQTFEEVNLRFYVRPDKDHSIRAVTFVKEIVPKAIIPLIANSVFNENYVSAPMNHGIDKNEFWYSWGQDAQNRFSATISGELSYPPKASLDEFITEHYWGYTKGPKYTLEYHVEHPQWKCCRVIDYEIQVDFAETYGERFAFLNEARPSSVQYAQGSAVTVSFPSRLHT